MTRLGHFLFCNVEWVDAQERHGTTVPYENEIFVNNWRAWRIREYTIKKILKNQSVRDFFDFIYCVSRRTHSHQVKNIEKPGITPVFYFVGSIFTNLIKTS